MSKEELMNLYNRFCQVDHANREHLPILRQLAKESSSVVEIGLNTMFSTWGILQGLSESPMSNRSYLGIDCNNPPAEILNAAKQIAANIGLSFKFWQMDDLHIDRLAPVDLLFLDSLHTYYHLSHELEKFSSQVRKYIAMHDTASPYGYQNEETYLGDYSEYFPNQLPPQGDQIKQGLWPAVVDFLSKHPEWTLQEHRANCCGFTVLKRVSDASYL